MRLLKRALLYTLLSGLAVFLCVTVSWNYEPMRALAFVLVPADVIGQPLTPAQLQSLGDLKLPLFFSVTVLFWSFVALLIDGSIRLTVRRARRRAG